MHKRLSAQAQIPQTVSEYFQFTGDGLWSKKTRLNVISDVDKEATRQRVSVIAWQQLATELALKLFPLHHPHIPYQPDLDPPNDLAGLGASYQRPLMANATHYQAYHSVRTSNAIYGDTVNFQHSLINTDLHEYLRGS